MLFIISIHKTFSQRKTKLAKHLRFISNNKYNTFFVLLGFSSLALAAEITLNNLTLDESNDTLGYTFNASTNTTTINSAPDILLVGFNHGIILNSGSLITNSAINYSGCTPGGCEASPGPTIYINSSILDITNSFSLTNTSPVYEGDPYGVNASAIKIDLTGSVRNISNNGTISGAFAGIENFSNDDNLPTTLFVQNITNSGIISGDIVGIYNGFSPGSGSLIKEIINTSTGQIIGTAAGGIYNLGTINLIQNSGEINQINNADGLSVIGAITNLTSGSLISGSGSGAINNFGYIGIITNSGSISDSSSGQGIYNNGATGNISSVINNANASITGSGGGGIYNYYGLIGTISNAGTISDNLTCGLCNIGNITSITNLSTGSIIGSGTQAYGGGTGAGIYNSPWGNAGLGTIDTISNAGVIADNSGGSGIYNGDPVSPQATTISNIINKSGGVISGSGQSGIDNDFAGSIDTIINIGTIKDTGVGYGISNIGSITTLANLQGSGNSAGALTYAGNLPTNYFIYITDQNHYGQINLSGITGAGKMTFGIYGGSIPLSLSPSSISGTPYLGVIQGISLADMTNQTYVTCGTIACNIKDPNRTYDGHPYYLVEEGNTNIWDLLFSGFGPSLANTQLSLQTQSSNLMSAFNLQKASINLGLNYDCTTFDSNGVCVGVGGRYTSLDSNSQFNNSSAMVVTSIKLGDNFRVGGYLDQNVSSKLTDISLSNNKGPLGGLFIVLAQNDKTHQGYELRLAGNYQSKHADISREVIGDSEAGSGNASLESYGALAQISYGFKASDKILLTQYLGVRYSQIKRSAYVEGSNVSTPLSYSELKDDSTTALAGLKLNIALADDFNIQGHLGIEDDVHQKIGNLTATGIDGLAPIVMSNDKNKFRGVAGLGAALNISKYQVLRGSVNYQQLPYQTKAATTAMFTYEIGL
jgi:hypothetical protein